MDSRVYACFSSAAARAVYTHGCGYLVTICSGMGFVLSYMVYLSNFWTIS